MICQRWISEVGRLVQLLDEQASKVQDNRVRLSLAPELNISWGPTEDYLPFLIENMSWQPIWNIRLIIHTDPSCSEILSSEPNSKGSSRYMRSEIEKGIYEITPQHRGGQSQSLEQEDFTPFLCPREYISIEVRQNNLKVDRIRPTLQYDDYTAAKRIIPLDIGECTLVMPYQETDKVDNPFNNNPSSPLLSKNIVLFADIPSRERTRKAIRKLITTVSKEAETGIWINLYGIPRIGKTTLLHQIAGELKDEQGYIPIRISFDECKGSETLMEIFHSIFSDIRYSLDDNPNLIWRGNSGSPLSALEQIIIAAYEILESQGDPKTLVLLVDNLKMFNRDPHGLDKAYKDLLINLTKLVEQRRIILILGTEERFDGNIAGYISREPREDLTFRLGLFNKDDLNAITQKAKGTQFSGLSLEYLYRITGGYPDAIHHICYYIAKDRANKKIGGIELSLVRILAKSLYEWKGLQALTSLINSNELNMLISLIREGRIDAKTLRVTIGANNIIPPLLRSLAEKEIFNEEVILSSDKLTLPIYTLRVGFMSLLDHLLNE